MTEKLNRAGTREALIYTAMLVFLLAVLTLPSVVLAGIAVFASRGLVARGEAIVVALTALVITFFDPIGVLIAPTHWFASLFTPLVYEGSVPILGTVVLAAIYASLWTIVSRTMLVTTIAKRSTTAAKLLRNPFHKESLVPSEREKKRARLASPPGGVLEATPSPRGDNQTAPAAPPGHAQVSVSVNSKLVPVLIGTHELSMHAMIMGSTGSGKALALDTPIPTPDGWTTMGDLEPGSRVFDEQGRPCTVTFTTGVQLERQCFEVRFSDGSMIVADADHRWVTSDARTGVTGVTTTAAMASGLRCDDGRPAHRVMTAGALRLPDVADFDATVEAAAIVARFDDPTAAPIPPSVLRAGTEQRRGLLDELCRLVDASPERGTCTFTAASARLGRSLDELVTGLGHAVRVRTGRRLVFDERPDPDSWRAVVAVTPVASVPVRCIQVDAPSHCYLAGSAMVPTHNTETIKSLAAALADLGYPVLLLDLKEDTAPGGLRDFAKEYALHHAVDFQELSLSDPEPTHWFNPFLGMGADEAREVVLSLTEFDDSYWQNINKKLLAQIVNLLYDAHEADPSVVPYPTMFELGRLLSQDRLPDATKKLRGIVKLRNPENYDEERYSALMSPTQPEQQSASGFGAKLNQMYATVAGRTILRPDPDGRRNELDATVGGITYVGLSTLAQRDLATVISSAVLQRMSVYAAARASGRVTDKRPRVVLIDEASLINRPIVKNLLARARSAGITMVLCTQSPTDWIDERGDDWADMANNVNVAFIMSQGAPRAAELCAEFIGEREQFQVSQSGSSGEFETRTMFRQHVDFIVPPHQLRGLSIGEMILRVGKPEERVVWSTVKIRDPKSKAAGRRLDHDGFGA